MDLLNKQDFDFDFIQSLITNKIEESIHLDYKSARALLNDESHKMEITKDISAFANSAGGIIVYGIREKDHIPLEVDFIDGSITTKEWLENIITSNISRTIPGLRIFPIRKDDDLQKTIFVIRIPESYNGAHMAKDKKYYRRYNFKSVPMEEYEVRLLYSKKEKGQLIVHSHNTILKSVSEDYELKVTCTPGIENVGNTTVRDFKLNLYITGIHPNLTIIHTDDNNKAVPLTLMNKDEVKLSFYNSVPIYPNEFIDFGTAKFAFPFIDFPEIIKSLNLTYRLFYENEFYEYDCDIKSIPSQFNRFSKITEILHQSKNETQ